MKLQGRGYQMKSIDDRALANTRHGYPHQELMRPRMATFHPDESNRRLTESDLRSLPTRPWRNFLARRWRR